MHGKGEEGRLRLSGQEIKNVKRIQPTIAGSEGGRRDPRAKKHGRSLEAENKPSLSLPPVPLPPGG